MVTLTDVQNEVRRQLVRDYSRDIIPSNVPFKSMCALGLAEEAGEVAGLMKRVIRDFPKDKPRITKEKFIEELGDVLWYLAACCETQNTSLDEIWEYNISKLKERYGE